MASFGDPQGLVRDFLATSAAQSRTITAAEIRYGNLRAPHDPPKLPPGYGAVYVFALGHEQGERAPAGPGFVLKVGRAGPKSNARFQSHHYHPGRALSTLAASILRHPEDRELLGISQALTDATVGSWMRRTLDRHHFFVDADDCHRILEPLERYLHTTLDPLYEGG